MSWKVYWDNGSCACGIFPQVFDTEDEAQQFADNWSGEMSLIACLDPGGSCAYFAEPIEVDDEPDSEGVGWDPLGELPMAGLDHRGRP